VTAVSLAPQETRTFSVSTSTSGKSPILQSQRLADLFLDVLRDYRAKQRIKIHEFVLMRDHIHLILTPAPDIPLEKAMQYIKGGFSFRAKRELGFNGEVWQKGYNEHGIKDTADYAKHVEYIQMNPVRAGLANRAQDYQYSSAKLRDDVDPAPPQFRR
jgi:REP-associated tyrosine transposase